MGSGLIRITPEALLLMLRQHVEGIPEDAIAGACGYDMIHGVLLVEVKAESLPQYNEGDPIPWLTWTVKKDDVRASYAAT